MVAAKNPGFGVGVGDDGDDVDGDDGDGDVDDGDDGDGDAWIDQRQTLRASGGGSKKPK